VFCNNLYECVLVNFLVYFYVVSELNIKCVFNARCTIVQRAVGLLRLHVVCPSVTLVDQDHISWKSRKLHGQLAHTFAIRSPKAIPLFTGGHGDILGRLELGWGKVAC